MVKYLKEAGIILVSVAFGLIVEVLMEASACLWASVLFGTGGGLLFIVGLNKRLWPDRTSWYITSSYPFAGDESDPMRLIAKDRRKLWRSSQPQERDAWFRVDLGKERMIASIDIEPDDSWVEKPGKWRMMFYGKGHRILGHKDGSGFIHVETTDMPKRIQTFEVRITEVAEDMGADSNYALRYGQKVFWAISLIKLSEYKFCILGRRFCKHEL